jgi:hydrogenase nickel incorporation protein HypA/HybF
MHELSVCQALIDEVQRLARQHGARRVLLIELAVGPLSGVEPQLLEHAYPLAAAGTLAAEAELRIRRESVRVRCRKCGAEGEVPANRLCCVACDDWQVQVTGGEELLLRRVEFEIAESGVAA